MIFAKEIEFWWCHEPTSSKA